MKKELLQDPVVSYETANLAFKRGFKDVIGLIKGKSYYNHKQVLNGDVTEELKEYSQLRKQFESKEEIEQHKTKFSIAAPTQSLLQKWLRDEYNIIVEIQFDSVSFGYRIFNPNLASDHFSDWKFDRWNFEQALEEGLKEALNLIK